MSTYDTGDWRDPTVTAVEERRAAEAAYLESWSLYGTADTAPAIPDPDPHRLAVRNRLREQVSAHDPLGDLESERAHRAYQERRRNAQTQVRLLEKVGEPVPDEMRRLAETPSAQESVDAILAQRAADTAAALRESSHPARGEDDGSLVQSYQGDPTGWMLEAERTKLRYPQIAAQRAMAERKAPQDLRLRRRRGR